MNAIVAIEAAYEDCDQRIAEIVVDEVVYEGVSDIVAGFRANKSSKGVVRHFQNRCASLVWRFTKRQSR